MKHISKKVLHRSEFYILLFCMAWLTSCSDDGLVPQTTGVTYIFWCSLGNCTIERASLMAGKVEKTLVLYDEVKGLQSPSALAAAPASEQIYWADYASRQILRGPWDGNGNPEVLYTASFRGTGPIDLSLDETNNMVFWTQPYDNLLLMAPADGSGPVDTLMSATDGVNGAWGISMSVSAGTLFWSEYADTEIWRMAVYEGTGPELIYAGGSGFLRPYGLAVDSWTGLLYIADNPLPGSIAEDRILRGNIGGSLKLEQLFGTIDGVNNVYNITVGPQHRYIYWHNQLNNGSIYRAPLDAGEGPELLIGNINVGQGLAVVKVSNNEQDN